MEKVMSGRKENGKSALPLKTRLSVLIASTITDFTRSSDGTVKRGILRFLDTPMPAVSLKEHLTSFDVTIDPSRNLWARFFLPTPTPALTTPLPVIIFFHGGGFAFLSAASKSYDSVCRHFARKLPAAVVSVNYRLSPEHKFPCQYIDGLDALRFLSSSENTEDPNLRLFLQSIDLNKAFLAGDSAGANIAHHVARDWTSDLKRSVSDIRIRGVVSIQPFFGGEERVDSEIRLKTAALVNSERTDWMWKSFLPVGETRDHEAVNVFGEKGKNVELGAEFPKVLVMIGGLDPLQDWQWKYVQGLRERKKDVKVIEYENAIHAFYLFAELPEAKLVVDEVREFIHSCF
ncbi:putative Acetyl esterase [Zostera marina]|uniref:Putative Acetyl esterase n=1 Tax=Zostera marina TaxID=29655 RepID=A0A0K9NKG8_ZOSMR|nr:putative Acetyl esterase [Zostera marina]